MSQTTSVVCTKVAAKTPHCGELKDILGKTAPVARRKARGEGGIALNPDAYRRWASVELSEAELEQLAQGKYSDRCTKLLFCCTQRIFGAENTSPTSSGDSMSVVVGTAFGTMRDQMDMIKHLEQGGIRAVEPVLFPNLVYNCPASRLAIMHSNSGPTATVTNGLCSGLDSLIHATQILKMNRASHVLACGVEELSEYATMGYHHCARQPEQSDFYPIEASGVAMLTTEERARAAGDSILGRLVHYRQSFYPGRISNTAAFGQAIADNFSALIRESGVDPSQIGAILTSMNGLDILDRAELIALESVVTTVGRPLAVVALKRIIGEATGASGLLQLATVFGGGLEKLDLTAHHNEVLPDTFRAKHAKDLASQVHGSHVIISNLGWMGNHTAVLVERAS